VSIGVSRIFFLDVGRVRKDHGAQVLGPRRAEDAAPEPLRDKPWQVTAMIEVRVGQDDGVEGGWGDGKRPPVSIAQLLQSLKQTTIDEDPTVAEVEEMFGSSDRAGRAEKRQRRHRATIKGKSEKVKVKR
jgi:hypothetical protein